MDQQFIQKRLLPLRHQDSKKNDSDLAEEKALTAYLKSCGKNSQGKLQQASVLLPLVRNTNDDHWDLILTRRSEHLKHHPGEISFPGGRFENSDKDLMTTAKRETQEEIGIEPSQIQLIGKLPKQNTISSYQVTPFVGIIEPPYQLTIDKNEVEEVFLVPLTFLLNSKNQKKAKRKLGEQSFSYYVFEYNQYYIWGATAKMIVNFSRMLEE